MKLSHLFLFTLLSLLAFSCDDDDDPMTLRQNDLVGVWEADQLEANVAIATAGPNGSSSANSFATTGGDFTIEFTNDNWIFTGGYEITLAARAEGSQSNGQARISTFPATSTAGGYSIENGLLNLTGNYQVFTTSVGRDTSGASNLTYSVSGNKLTITQVREITTVDGDVTTTSTASTVSTWTRR